MLEGRRLHTKLTDGTLATQELKTFRQKAQHGSQQLRDAILRAKGYAIVESQKVKAAPVFKPVQIKPRRGRPKGSKKIHAYNFNVVRIIGLVAENYGLSVESLLGRGRKRDIAVPRHVAMYLVRKIEGVSYPGIGHQFGGRDHTTIIAGIRDVDRLIEAGDNRTIKALHFVQARMGA
jgi:hypothetical protein